jgi:uncharacterized protein YjeT (DUF2065 family)|tara:strand:- start:43 stop:231 length:189 start_codon:yes stop_codon:yes gene_type:complete
VIQKVLFAIGSVVVFEGFFLAIIPERLKKTLSQISIIPNKHLSRVGLAMMAIGIIIIGVTDI